MQNTMHLHRQASYQLQFPCLPLSTRFRGVKSTDQIITRPPDSKITKLLNSRWGCVCLVTVSAYTQLAHLTYWDDHTGANTLALRWQISRFISCPPLVITHHVTLSGSNFIYTNCALSSESLSLFDDGFYPTTGRRSLTWQGMPPTCTDCELIILVTCPILSLSVHLLCVVLTHTTSPILYFPSHNCKWYVCTMLASAVVGKTPSFGVTLYQ